MTSKNLVWHYTSLNTLSQILKHQELWATEVGFQNDPYEASFAQSFLKKRLQERLATATAEGPAEDAILWQDILIDFERESVSSTDFYNPDNSHFILCASTFDNFFAWRTYGSVGEVGCAIGLDRTIPLSAVSHSSSSQNQEEPGKQTMGPSSNAIGPTSLEWENVTYVDLHNREAYQDLIDEIKKTYSKPLPTAGDGEGDSEDLDFEISVARRLSIYIALQSARSVFKSWSYRHEEEARVTATDVTRSDISFRDGLSGPRPFVRLTGPRNRLPIRAVMLGPTAGQSSLDSLTYLLRFNGYSVLHEDSDSTTSDHTGASTASRTKVCVSRSKHDFRNI